MRDHSLPTLAKVFDRVTMHHRWHGVLVGYATAPFFFLFGKTQDAGSFALSVYNVFFFLPCPNASLPLFMLQPRPAPKNTWLIDQKDSPTITFEPQYQFRDTELGMFSLILSVPGADPPANK